MRSAVRMSGALWLRTCSPPLATMLSMRMLMTVMMMSGAAAAACADAQDALRASAGLFLMDNNWKEAVRIFSTAAAGGSGCRIDYRQVYDVYTHANKLTTGS
jgi:ABC-type sugar transport system substrate-binding protein